jgi:hypothetical protein
MFRYKDLIGKIFYEKFSLAAAGKGHVGRFGHGEDLPKSL